MEGLEEILGRPANPTTFGSRAAAILSDQDELVFGTITIGDIIYDRISIDPAVLQAFDFAHSPNVNDIHELATWSHSIIEAPSVTYEGNVSRLQGYVFERMAALSLRQSGAVVEFPDTANNPGWDFLVNGDRVQAKCGISPNLVIEHFEKYPDIPRVVVNEELASHFVDNDNVTAVHGITRDSVRAVTEHNLDSAADMLDLHLIYAVPAMSIARNAYHLWRGNTDWRALPGNVTIDAAGRFLGAGAGHVIGAVVALGLGGWPAILLPVFTATAGSRGGRVMSNGIKRRLLLKTEYATLSSCLLEWCQGAARVICDMIRRADKTGERISAARERAHPEFRSLFDDWQERLAAEQSFRRLHLDRFTRGSSDSAVFDDGKGPLDACAAAMVAASRAGILPADLSREKRSLTAGVARYAEGLRRRLLPF
jgi:hypothetical protein